MARKTYHLCLSSHDEAMFRDEADLNMGFNALALAVLSTESRALAEGFMTTHHHSGVQTDVPKELMRRFRYTYSRYFNARYSRSGRLGERKFFSLEVVGLHHMVAMLNYILRQGLHHGLSTTAFGYPFGSANSFFRRELGKDRKPEMISSSQRYKYLPDGVSLPERYRMDRSGLLLREDILDTAYVEEIYITPRNFLFQMNKMTDEKDLYAQKEENDTRPVTIDMIEAGVEDFDVRQALINEQGRVNHQIMTDLELCRVIDTQLVPRYLKEDREASVYALPQRTRERIAEGLWQESLQTRYRMSGRSSDRFLNGKSVTEKQLRRCLVCRETDK